jgi:prepilin-type N-terminal cleavage/methylation domain-containing protein
MRRRGQAGFTLVELMISMVLAAIATGFAFSIYSRAGQASRAQARVAEVQQALRAATELMSKELRQAGFMAKRINEDWVDLGALKLDDPAFPLEGAAFVPFDNLNGDGPDAFRVIYADTSVTSKVTPLSITAAASSVDSSTGWQNGDLALVVKVGDEFGQACIVKITLVLPGVLEHSALGAPWNNLLNSQCELLQSWGDGSTIFTKMVARMYRIRPNDARGVLQMSPSGGFIADDWQDIALGIIDLQLAIDVATDVDGRNVGAAPTNQWFSAANMTAAVTPIAKPGVNEPSRVRLSLLAKSLAPAGGAGLDSTPDFFNSAEPLDHNSLGNRPGTVLPVADTTSPYYGDNLYRWSTVTIDLRNMALGL